MGAEQSKQEDGNSRALNEEEEKKKNDSSSSSSMGSGSTALAVGAAVGTALLGVAWGVNRYNSRSDDSDHQVRVGRPESRYNPESGSLPIRNLLNLRDAAAPTTETLKIMSYNVWFREDVQLNKRMIALGSLIQKHSPDVICFQEVTPNIYAILQNSSWWHDYSCSVSAEMANTRKYFCMQLSKAPVKSFNCKPFSNSKMGRELCVAGIDVKAGKTLVIATSHLESPTGWDQMHSKERVSQVEEALMLLNRFPNVIFGGDMNWDDKLDGVPPLPAGWVDAWEELNPGEDGYTYDTKSNSMLAANKKLQKRLDRFFCNLNDFKISQIEMIGTQAIPSVFHREWKTVRGERKEIVLPVLPSDHYGLLLTLCRE